MSKPLRSASALALAIMACCLGIAAAAQSCTMMPPYIHEQRYAQNYPPAEREVILRQYMQLSASYLKRLDTEVLVTYAEMRPELLGQFAKIQGVKGNRTQCPDHGDVVDQHLLGGSQAPITQDHFST